MGKPQEGGKANLGRLLQRPHPQNRAPGSMSCRGTEHSPRWRFPSNASPWYVWSLHRLVWEFVPTLQSSTGEAVLDMETV